MYSLPLPLNLGNNVTFSLHKIVVECKVDFSLVANLTSTISFTPSNESCHFQKGSQTYVIFSNRISVLLLMAVLVWYANILPCSSSTVSSEGNSFIISTSFRTYCSLHIPSLFNIACIKWIFRSSHGFHIVKRMFQHYNGKKTTETLTLQSLNDNL